MLVTFYSIIKGDIISSKNVVNFHLRNKMLGSFEKCQNLKLRMYTQRSRSGILKLQVFSNVPTIHIDPMHNHEFQTISPLIYHLSLNNHLSCFVSQKGHHKYDHKCP